MTELLASHSLIFDPDKSKAIVKSLDDPQSDKTINLEVLAVFNRGIKEARAFWQLSDFPIFGRRLKYLHERMTSWRPLRVCDLFHRPYRDPIPYWAFWFGTFIGVVTFCSLAIGIGQLVVAKTQST
jgi:hypothetical protein